MTANKLYERVAAIRYLRNSPINHITCRYELRTAEVQSMLPFGSEYSVFPFPLRECKDYSRTLRVYNKVYRIYGCQ
jgi:hypothetical protein